MRSLVLLCLLSALAVPSTRLHGQSSGVGGASVEAGQVVIPEAHMFVLRDVNRQVPYRIYVAFPPGYANSSRRYPVLYMLDGDGAFALATQAYRLLRVDSTVTDLILVGIGYEFTGAARRAQRIRDLTPSQSPSGSATGESAAFLNSITRTIIPVIDSLYRTEAGDRAIFGHSLGGLFALYALFEQPDVFRRYIVSSPSIWWDNGIVLRLESRFAQNRRHLPKSVFMSVGADEPPDMLGRFQPLADSLNARQYRDFNFSAIVLPDETHLSVLAIAFLRGLRTVYR